MRLKYLALVPRSRQRFPMAKILSRSCLAGCILLLAGCAGFGTPPPAGTSESELVARLGAPTARYPLAHGEHLLEYRRGPWGQQTYMARFDADGRLQSYEQVLTMKKFGTIRVDHDNKDDVLRTIGAPSETAYFPRLRREVWSYPYRESGVWNSLMSVYFDDAGIVRKLENGPDPKFDPDRGRFGRMFR